MGRVLTWAVLAALGWGAVQLARAAYIPVKAGVAQVLLARAWARAQRGEVHAKPWGWADTWPVAKIEVPRLGQSAIVLASASGQSLAFGPGQVEGTAALGSYGTTVIAAHRDTHFRFLADVRVGDELRATATDGAVYTYRVTHTQVRRFDASGIDPQAAGPSGASLALVTCYPFAAITHGPERYVVWAEREAR